MRTPFAKPTRAAAEAQAVEALAAVETAGLSPILDIGCGPRKRGTVGMDIYPFPEVDVLYDVADGVPLPDDSVDGVYMYHVLEHLPMASYEHVLGEIWRVCRDGAWVRIKTPHFSCGRDFFQDPTHVRPFASTTFTEYFTQGAETHFSFYRSFRFRCESVRINYNTFPEDAARRPRLAFLVRGLERLANSSPLMLRLCERRWCYWVGGFAEIHATLVAVKQPGG